MAAQSPTARSLAALRDDGWNPWVVEAWIMGANIRRDLWNFGDILAMKVGSPHLIVQTTTASNMTARVLKIISEPRALEWLHTGGLISVHGWRKKTEGLRQRWVLIEQQITEADFKRNQQ